LFKILLTFTILAVDARITIMMKMQSGENARDSRVDRKVLKLNHFPSNVTNESLLVVCNHLSEWLRPRLEDSLEVFESEVTRSFLNRSENFLGAL
jgi:hypothetical protein